jgi:dTDP-4-dehydrorhamnose 3,5-epimerase
MKLNLTQPSLNEKPVFIDHRGTFCPTELDGRWIQTNISVNDLIYTFRGMHLQHGDKAQTKRLKVIRGSIIDFVIDMRPESSTFEKMSTYTLLEGFELEIPAGFAHGFLTMTNNTIVQYLVDKPYDSHSDESINYQSIEEICELVDGYPLVISDKDKFANDYQRVKNKILSYN